MIREWVTETRKFALTRLGPGDYLCPSNDERTLWRFSSYDDGRCGGLVVDYERRTFWSAQTTPLPLDAVDFDDVKWRLHADHFATRRDAIRYAFGDAR